MAVELRGQQGRLRRPAPRQHGQVRPCVVDQRVGAALDVRQAMPVGAPGDRTITVRVAVRAGVGGQLPRHRAPVGLDDPHVVVVAAVGVGAALARKGQVAAIRRPGGRQLVVRPEGELLQPPVGQGKQVEVRPLAAHVPAVVFLEVVPVDHQRRLGLRGGGIDGRRRLLRRGDGIGEEPRGLHRIAVLDDHHQPVTRGGPGVVRDARLDLRDPLGLAAGAGQQPELVGALVIAAAAEEGQVAPVGAPPRRVLALPGGGGQAQGGPPVPARHPQVAGAVVVLEPGGADGIGHPLTVGRELGIPHVAELVQVGHRDGARGILAGERKADDGGQQERQAKSHGILG